MRDWPSLLWSIRYPNSRVLAELRPIACIGQRFIGHDLVAPEEHSQEDAGAGAVSPT